MLKKVIKKIAVICVVAAAAYLTYYCVNRYMLSNREQIGDNYHSITMADNVFDKTTFRRQYNNDNPLDEVYQKRLFKPSKKIHDGGEYGKYDGLVDRIDYVESLFNKKSGSLKREKHYERYKAEFDDADNELKEAKERFKVYLR